MDLGQDQQQHPTVHNGGQQQQGVLFSDKIYMLDGQVNYNSLLTGKVFSIIDDWIFLVAFLYDVNLVASA